MLAVRTDGPCLKSKSTHFSRFVRLIIRMIGLINEMEHQNTDLGASELPKTCGLNANGNFF